MICAGCLITRGAFHDLSCENNSINYSVTLDLTIHTQKQLVVTQCLETSGNMFMVMVVSQNIFVNTLL